MAASTVLNGSRTSSRISPETRDRILKAASRLSYRPNAAARALANRRMNTIGVATVFTGRGLNHYFLEVLNGILEAAAEREQNTTVFTLHDWGHDPARLHSMCDGRIDGLILLSPRLTPEAAKMLPNHTPFVTIHATGLLRNVVNIESDEGRGAYEMVRHLIARGHQRIMHVSGDSNVLGAHRRIQGYKQALVGARIPFRPELLVETTFETDDGREALRRWLRLHAGEALPEAIFCANDSVAIGCLEALAELGLRVPDDISVAGFDDSLLARTAVPQLTTVRQPLSAMGRRTVEELLARIAQKDGDMPPLPCEPIVYPVDLVLRSSVAAPPVSPRLVPLPLQLR